MSYHSYLKLEEKILVDVGNHINEEQFLKDLEVYRKLREEVGYLDVDIDAEEPLWNRTIKDVTVKDLTQVLQIYALASKFSMLQSNLYALDLAYRNFENVDEIEIIGENKLEEYKDWKVVC